MSVIAQSILIASNNAHKLQEFQEIFTQFGQQDTEIHAPNALNLTLDPEETGQSYLENARIKSNMFHSFISHNPKFCLMPVVADDSGLEVDALAGAPGVHSARFHKSAPDGDGCSALLRAMARVPEGRRTARFRSVIVLITPDGQEHQFEGICEGSIAFDKRGSGGFGFDPIFQVAGDPRHLAEYSAEEKHRISHRGKAAQQLIAFLKATRRAT